MLSLETLRHNKYEPQDLQHWHIEALASTMGADDRREVRELYEISTFEVLRRSAERSPSPKALVCLPDTVLCCCGVVPDMVLLSSGQIWCLTSETLPEHAVAFLRSSRRWLREQQTQYSMLWNYVPVWHSKSLSWLKWLGFTLKLETESLVRVEIGGTRWADQQEDQ